MSNLAYERLHTNLVKLKLNTVGTILDNYLEIAAKEGKTTLEVLDYLMDQEKHGKQSQELFQGYIDEFPEKDWKLPDETWLNNFLAWLFFEKVLPQTGKTIAEEFVENTPDLSPEMKEKVLKMKNIIRSKFLVISKKDLFFKVKDMNSGDVYNVKLGSASHVVPNAVITGRIHPFGDHYRFAGVFLISTSLDRLDV